MDERFVVLDYDLDDDDPMEGDCGRCGNFSVDLEEANKNGAFSGMLLCRDCKKRD